MGVDCFKTDFGERIPTDVVWHDGSDPQRMHNYYAHLYNRAVFELLEAERGRRRGGAVRPVGDRRRPAVPGALGRRLRVDVRRDGRVAARRTVAGGVRLRLLEPRHRRLRGHAGPGGVQALDRLRAAVRHTAGCTAPARTGCRGRSTTRRSRCSRHFTRLKLSLMPYLAAAAEEAHADGIPMMRPMVLEFPDDPTAAYLDRQYMLGARPPRRAGVAAPDGEVTFYVPAGTWTHLVTGEQLTGPGWVSEKHGFDSAAAARPARLGDPVRRRGRPAGLRLGRRRGAAPVRPDRGAADPRPGSRRRRRCRWRGVRGDVRRAASPPPSWWPAVAPASAP